MTPERWHRIEQIYHAAMERGATERASFLEQACAGDETLRRQIVSLIAAGDQDSDFLNAPALELGSEQVTAKLGQAPARSPNTSSAPSLAQSLIGTQVGNYRILSQLGAGGMGEVFLARDARLDRKVAIKMLPVEFTRDAGRLRRFEQEARAASALNHPNIITIYEISETETEFGKAHFIATEFIEGLTLRQLTGSSFSFNDALEVAIQVASALAAAHQAGIIHRDIKPENLMVRPDGLVKVLDFGLAKLTIPYRDSIDTQAATLQAGAETAPGMILGTLRYMSPEQARGLPVDARSDIFSLGVVLYEMIAGSAPFNGQTASDVIAAILTAEPLPLGQAKPEAPPELQGIVDKAMRKNKDERYQTCKDLLADLKDLKGEMEFSAKLERSTGSAKALRTEEVAPAPSTSPAALTSRRWLTPRVALMMLPLMLLVVVAVWWLVAGNGGETFSPASLKTVEITSWPSAPGEVYSVGAFSPDGQAIAFASTRSGSKNIWVKRTASGEAIQITKDEFANENPIWSPDGNEIAFFSLRGNHPGIWRIPAFGGTPVLITALQDGDVRLRRWSRNSATIYYELSQNLFALDVKSGQATQFTNLDPSNINPDSLSLSPDEQRVAYISTTQDGRNGVWVAPARGGAPQQIASDVGHDRNTVWHPDSKRVLYSANVDGVYQIFVADIDGPRPARVTFSDINSFALDVSPDGARILYGSTKEESDVWGINVAGGEESALTSDLGSELWPDVSPDGKTVVYQAVRNLSQGDKISSCSILTKQANSEEPFRLADNGALPKWSPDGNRVAFVRLVSDIRSLWTVKAAGGEERQLTTGEMPSIEYTLLPYLRLQASNFSWSPDSSRIAYCSKRSGRPNLWVVAADGSGDVQITNNGDPNLLVNCPLWSSDGNLIAYSSKPNEIAADGKMTFTVWLTEVGKNNSKAILQSDTFVRLIGWAEGDKELILATFNSGISGAKDRSSSTKPTEVGLIRVSPATGEQRPIAVLQSAYLYNIHLSADRRTIAFSSREDGKDNIWLIPSAGGQARKLTSNTDSKLYFSSLSWSPDSRAIYFGKQSRHSLLSMITNFK
jgi:Tol biopolymer transport system component